MSNRLTRMCSLLAPVTLLLALAITPVSANSKAYDKICMPSNSPELPPRVYPIPLVRKTFDQIVEATSRVNKRRRQYAMLQPKGKNYRYVQEILLGLQLDALGDETLAEVLPAIDIALDTIQESSAYSGITFTTVPILHMTSVGCDSLAVLSKFDNREIHVLFGPLNDFSIANVARFSSSVYKIPIVTPAGFAHQLKDKYEYEMLTRVFLTYSDLAWVINATLRQFGWTPESLTPIGIYGARNQRSLSSGGHNPLLGVFQMQSLQNFLVKEGFKMFQVVTEEYEQAVEQYLKRLPKNVRISILCADPTSVRYIMLKAHELGFTNGEYVFISVDLFGPEKRMKRPWYQEDSTREENERAREAYRSLMVISLRRVESEAYRLFSDNVRARALRDYNTEYNVPVVPVTVGLFHDSVKLYTIALDDALSSGVRIDDGVNITRLMRSRTFEGITGIIRIDSNGDRNADYSLLDLDPASNTFEPVADYFAINYSIRMIPGKTIDWANQKNLPPPGVPVCGFDGNKCQHSHVLVVIASGTALFAVFLIVGISLGVYFYRRAELQAISWIIDWCDLEFPNKTPPPSEVKPSVDETDPRKLPDQSCCTGSALPPDTISPAVDTAAPLGTPPPTDVRFFINNEASPSKPRRRSFFTGKSVSISSGGVHNSAEKRKSAIKFSTKTHFEPMVQPERERAQEQQQITAEPSDEPSMMHPSAVKRFQQRWARRSRITEDSPTFANESSGTASAPMLMYRSGARAQTENVYVKNPSFDYSSVVSKHRPFGGRRKTDYGEFDPSVLFENTTGRRKKDSQASGFSTEMLMSLYAAKFQGTCAMYKGSKVYLKPARRQHRIESNKETAVEVNKIKDLNNDHICRLIGVCLEPSRQYFVMEYCPKGSLYDFLKNERFTMDWLFKLSLMQDICRGMTYLHQLLVPHGYLKSSNCLLDSRFAVKLTDFGLPRIRGANAQKFEFGTAPYYYNLLWTAPELLPTKDGEVPKATFKGDVYAYAIICQELIYRKGPFYIEEENQPPAATIIAAVEERQIPSYRPVLQVQEEGSEAVIQMIRRAWDDDPNKRPDFRAIGKIVGSDSSENLIDNLVERMQNITTNLEQMVDKRTEQYMDEKKRAEDLLYSMLPKAVASQLIKKHTVEAESFEMVTIYFSDIVGFTALSAGSTPMEVVNLLNALYTLFDGIIDNFRVYKVETIGDAYMVASGLPKRIGNEHAREIARMSIAFLKAIFEFQIPHRPHQRLELRIGVHSGRCLCIRVSLTRSCILYFILAESPRLFECTDYSSESSNYSL
ncbi:hypothetical protein T265_11311 [Opisthorchis viverrini]|uniref:guanylate cyclase n=1 Tax=Opisthorchis viverrini TaxID=6198 RepID=A0A074YZ25_OPIVI|nr:hypothetical protein T265_11311 [Opisthorchis viverrini]KER20046.1 hypothetical protein T265_11311 [Opisthorchis viverrini]